MDFEDDVINAYKDNTYKLKNKILTFEDLSKEFLENIRNNLSISYYSRAKDVISKFNTYLEDNNLSKEPISEIKVRDAQMFFNSFQTYKKQNLKRKMTAQ